MSVRIEITKLRLTLPSDQILKEVNYLFKNQEIPDSLHDLDKLLAGEPFLSTSAPTISETLQQLEADSELEFSEEYTPLFNKLKSFFEEGIYHSTNLSLTDLEAISQTPVLNQ